MKSTCMSSDYIPQFFSNSLPRTLLILIPAWKIGVVFLFVRYKRHCCTELVSCLLSGIKNCPLMGGWLNTSSVVISIGATASVHYREVVHSWEGPLWEVPLYTSVMSCLLSGNLVNRMSNVLCFFTYEVLLCAVTAGQWNLVLPRLTHSLTG